MTRFIYPIISLLLFVIAPEEFSVPVCIACALIFVFHFYRIFRLDTRHTNEGLLSFNLFFALSAFAVVFVFPIFLYSTNIDYSFRALSIFRESAINKVTALSTFGYSIYLLSYEYHLTSSLKQSSYTRVGLKISDTALLVSKTLAILSVFAFTVNILFFVQSVDSSHNELTVNTYIAELTKCFLTVCLLCCAERYKGQIKDNGKSFFLHASIPIICFAIVMLEYLYIGDRGFVIVGGLTLLFSYVHYVKKIRAIIFIPTAIIAIIFISLVGQLRKTDSSFREGGLSSFTTASKETIGGASGLDMLEYISDLTLVSNVAYLEWDYSSSNFLYKPERVLVLLSMPIPLAPSLIANVMYNDNVASTSTGYTVTNYYNSQVTNAGDGGLGTQMIMDLYMSWRIVGVIIGMWLLGLFIGNANAFKDDNIYYLILLITFFGLAIYLPRSTIYVCFRTIVWEILFIIIIARVQKTKIIRK